MAEARLFDNYFTRSNVVFRYFANVTKYLKFLIEVVDLNVPNMPDHC